MSIILLKKSEIPVVQYTVGAVDNAAQDMRQKTAPKNPFPFHWRFLLATPLEEKERGCGEQDEIGYFTAPHKIAVKDTPAAFSQ